MLQLVSFSKVNLVIEDIVENRGKFLQRGKFLESWFLEDAEDGERLSSKHAISPTITEANTCQFREHKCLILYRLKESHI